MMQRVIGAAMDDRVTIAVCAISEGSKQMAAVVVHRVGMRFSAGIPYDHIEQEHREQDSCDGAVPEHGAGF